MKELRITFTEKNVSAWVGMKLMKDMLDSIGIKEFMPTLDLPEPGSNRGYDPIQIIECFWTSIWIGAGRFSTLLICAMTKYCKKYLVGNKRRPKVHTVDFFKN